jgi:hypothetical protein
MCTLEYGNKVDSKVYGDSSRARSAIHSRDTVIRICNVPQLKRKICLSKSHHGAKVGALQNIFAGLFNEPFLKYGHILGITLWWRPQAPTWQACRWEHRPSSSAACAVPIGPSRIGRHIKEEPCAKQRASLGVSSSCY